METRTDSAGSYKVPDLMPGDYELSVAAEGYSPSTVTVITIPIKNEIPVYVESTWHREK